MICPACGYDEMKYETWDKLVSFQGKSLTVHAVSGNRCPECGEAVFDDESYDRVVAASDGLIRAAHRPTPEVRNHPR